MPSCNRALLKGTELGDCYFNVPGREDIILFALGNTSLLNDGGALKANVRLAFNGNEHLGPLILVLTSKDVTAGEQLFLDYSKC
jgi:hypothetical protein